MQEPSQLWQARATLREGLRLFFKGHNYLEIDTPIAVPCPGTEVHLQYFKTQWRNYRSEAFPLWLRSSPELHMKQALADGLSRIFQLAPCFRNGGELSPWHHPEFTMLEWYRSGIEFTDYMHETIDLLRFTHDHFAGSGSIRPHLSLPERFEWWTVSDAFRHFAGISLVDGDPDLAIQAKACGVVSVNLTDDFETAFFKILLEKIEPAFQKLAAVVLYDYPASQAALARIEGGVAKRFEIYLHGVELCNGFYELLDPHENRLRVQASNTMRQQLGHEVTGEDHAFYRALEQGIPACCGNALGFDRWLALLLGKDHLDDVIPFRRQAPFDLVQP